MPLHDWLPDIDGSYILEDALGVAAGAGLAALGAVVLWSLGKKVGSSAVYAGLSEEEVQAVAQGLDDRCDILSRVHQRDGDHEWYRGIFLGGACQFPLYYRWDLHHDSGRQDWSLYPLLWPETWTTDPGWLDLGSYQTGEVIVPPYNGEAQGGAY